VFISLDPFLKEYTLGKRMILLSACIDFIILHALTSSLLLCRIQYSVPPPSPLFPALWARETQEAQDTN
jgi:hypothetical protein